MKRGMITLSLAAVHQLKTLAHQHPHFPQELSAKLSYQTQEASQSFEINEETAQSLLDLLPPPHTIKDSTLQEINQTFRSFIQRDV
jgi:hypothetical protein